MKRILILLSCLAACIGCMDENDASTIAIFATPSATNVNSGEKIYIDLNISTLNSAIETVEVSSFDSQYGLQSIHKATPGRKTYQEKIFYTAPYIETDSTFVEFFFKASDNTGAETELTTKIKINGGDGLTLTERTSIVIYSPFSGNDDAFSFSGMQPLKTSASEDKDIDMCFLYESPSDAMPSSIGTRTDIVYTRANNFDYPSATWGGIKSVYKNSLRSNHVDRIALDDVILVGRQTQTDTSFTSEPIGVFKIMAIYDEEGSSSDRIVINLKTTK